MIIDGRTLAKEVLARAYARASELAHPPRVVAFVMSETAATASYLSIKEKRAQDAGCVLEVVRLPQSTTTENLCEAITTHEADAILVQLPLPGHIDSERVCNAIPQSKDADVLSSLTRRNGNALLAPVVGAVREIFDTYNITPQGKNTVVIGNGFLVGAPVAKWLLGEGAQVHVLTLGDDLSILKTADIIVSGAGSPHLITPEMIREGVVLIDAATSESSGKIAGDADPLCAAHCALFTPVPGGVGPLAVACLFDNATKLAKSATNPA